MSHYPTELTPIDRLVAESAIHRLIATYVHNLDNGNIAANAALLADARFQVIDTVVVGGSAIAQFLETNVQQHEDGTPRTWHAISNTLIDFDSATTAQADSYFTVHQAVPGLPLQPIVTGHYLDTFACTDGIWRFASRKIVPRLFGEVGHHVAPPAGVKHD